MHLFPSVQAKALVHTLHKQAASCAADAHMHQEPADLHQVMNSAATGGQHSRLPLSEMNILHVLSF
jgi:hypothetical protein